MHKRLIKRSIARKVRIEHDPTIERKSRSKIEMVDFTSFFGLNEWE